MTFGPTFTDILPPKRKATSEKLPLFWGSVYYLPSVPSCISTISIAGGSWMVKPYRTYSWKAPADFYKLLRLEALSKKQRKNGN